MSLRSERWFGGNDLAGFIHRTSLHADNRSRTALDGRPVVGICNSWSELVTCNLHFRGLAEAVRRGVAAAGGVPLEFPTVSLGENLMKPTAMLFRNLMSMDVEESHPRLPARRGGADRRVRQDRAGAADGRATADVPAIMLTGGPAEPAIFRGRELGAGTDLWHYVDDVRAGRMTSGRVRRARGGGGRMAPATATRWAPPPRWPRSSRRWVCRCPGTAAIPAGDATSCRGGRGDRRARGGDRARGAAAVADRHRRGARQRDHGADGARRRHERRRSPAGARRAGRACR